MMTTRLFKILVILAVTALATGCKVALMVPSGGNVTSASGTKNCTGGSLCEHNITGATFSETFTAVAKPGYVFSKWSAGSGFMCANSVSPSCTISNVGLGGIAGVDGVIAGGSFFYAMPLFDFVGIDTDGDGVKDHLDGDDDNDGVNDPLDNCPLVGPNANGFGCPWAQITDTVTANGREWAQVDLFTNLSWNEINAVCPAGVCAGMLKGYDMTGWTWASLGDVVALFNSYGISPPLLELGASSAIDSPWALAFFGDGWRRTFTITPITTNQYMMPLSVTEGWSRTTRTNIVSYPYAYTAIMLISPADGNYYPDADRAIAGGDHLFAHKSMEIGAWFYR